MLPAVSVEVTLTVVVPTGKFEFDAGLAVVVAAPQLSLAETANVTRAVVAEEFSGRNVVMSAGTVIAGSVRSTTVTI
jgi:hypothetical protein